MDCLNKKSRLTSQWEGETDPARLPANLTPGFPNCSTSAPTTLEEAVQFAVSTVDNVSLKPPVREVDGLLARTRSLLAVLTLCYARQIYSSKDVSEEGRQDADFTGLCGEAFCDAQTIRRFRNENRGAIYRCLMEALRFLWAEKASLGLLFEVNETQLAEETNRRIVLAMFFDSMELDWEQPDALPAELSYLISNGRSRML